MSDHYSTLGLNSAATLADVKKAFRQKAAFYHPDRNAADDAAARFRAVQEAYDVLQDPDKRQAYDDNRRRNLLDDPLATAQEIWQSYFKSLSSKAFSTIKSYTSGVISRVMPSMANETNRLLKRHPNYSHGKLQQCKNSQRGV